MKGKGVMTTYFIVADKWRQLKEPNDEFRDLCILTDLERENQPVTGTVVKKKSKYENPKTRTCCVS